MNLEEYRQFYRIEDTHWWFTGRRAAFLRLLDSLPRDGDGGRERLRILDVGCGTGRFMEEAGRLGDVWGVDPAADAVACCRERGLARIARATASALPFHDGAFDRVTASDVLEHLEDDLAGAREMFRVLAPGGWAVAGVPAFQSLWSSHDVAMHHHRRYRADQLRRTLVQAGFEVPLVTYANAIPFGMIAPFRLLRRALRGDPPTPEGTRSDVFIEMPGLVNGVLRAAALVEARLLGAVRIPFGLSLIARARRPR